MSGLRGPSGVGQPGVGGALPGGCLRRAVVLLTDFGPGSPYVGAVKGVVSAIAPATPILDLAHDVRPQAVGEAAFVLGRSWRWFPPGSVFMAVVDPGVGGERAILALETPEALFLAPDNGLLSYVWDEAVKRETRRRLFAVTNRRYFLPRVSATFHGRDIFAPVAAHLADGLPVHLLGPRLAEPSTFPIPYPEAQLDGSLRCHVLYVDAYGNLVTDATPDLLPTEPLFEVAGRTVRGVVANYAAGEGLLALVDSWNHVEIALRDGNAARMLGSRPGDVLTVRPARR